MTAPHPESSTHDGRELILAVLAGEIAPDDPRVRALPAEAGAELERLLNMRAELDADGALDHALERRAARMPATPSPEVERFLRARAPHPAASRRRTLVAVLTLAAAVVALLWIGQRWRWAQDAREPRPDAILGEGVEILEPRGASPDLEHFRWRGAAPAGGKFVLRVWRHDANAPDRAGAQLWMQELVANEWVAPQRTPADEIVWRVDVVGFDVKPELGRPVHAWREDRPAPHGR